MFNVVQRSVPPVRPLLSTNFAVPYPDVIQWNLHHPNDETRSEFRFALNRGILTVNQFGSEDGRLPHELGHLMSLPVDRWWRSGRNPVKFDFRRPTTRKGVMQLCENEIAAVTIENALATAYMIWTVPPESMFPSQLKDYCEYNFNFLHPDGLDFAWIKRRYAQQQVSIKTVHDRWSKMVDELRVRRRPILEAQQQFEKNLAHNLKKFIEHAKKRQAFWG